MCGIAAVVCSAENQNDAAALTELLAPGLKLRGPDATSACHIDATGDSTIYLHGSVLNLRGEVTPQPISDAAGNLLLWNGEVFDGLELGDSENDTAAVLAALSTVEGDDVLSLVSSIRGPWAMVYWQASQNRLWFGRDYFGRRSLVWNLPTEASVTLAIASTAADPSAVWEEVPATGLFCIEFTNSTFSGKTYLNADRFAWPLIHHEWVRDVPGLRNPIVPFNRELPSEPVSPAVWNDTVTELIAVLTKSISRRLCWSRATPDQNGVGILFSGGVDSMVIAALVDRVLPPDEPIDLINVAL